MPAARIVALALSFAFATHAQSATPLATQISTLLTEPTAARAHWGIAVTELDGTPIYGLDEGKLFRPASNAKLFTTAAALATMGADKRFTTRVLAEGETHHGILRGNLVLMGGGDANFAGGYTLPYVAPAKRPKDQPVAPALADIDELAAKVVATGLEQVDGDVIGDDSAYEQPPYAEGWSIDDMLWGYGAPVSALSIHDNQIDVKLTPAADGKANATIALTPEIAYYRINPAQKNSDYAPALNTLEFDREALQRFDRAPGSRDLFITGYLNPGQSAVHEEIAIDDPAEYAAIAMRDALIRHGVRVKGSARALHKPNGDLKGFLAETMEPLPPLPAMLHRYFHPGTIECLAQVASSPNAATRTLLAEHISPPLLEDVILTAKVSQNLHAEMMLRNISAEKGCGSSLARSLQLVRQFWIQAGLNGDEFVLYDGSGLSAKDLVTPHALTQLLVYAAKQPWFGQWKAALPVGGEDGSLASRFSNAPLKGHVFAKTGTLGESRALSGYLDCASGKQVIFSILVDDHAPSGSNDRDVMDKIVAAIAAAE